jgi:phosphohistidine phosphatase
LTKKLILLRHAKSGWDDPVARDFDRPLNRRGEKAARLVGRWMKNEAIDFDHVIASPAVRVIETLDHIVGGYGRRIEATWERRVYLASSATLMDVMRELGDDIKSVMMVGHNPGMEDLVLELVAEDIGGEMRALVYEKFPTAAIAEIELDIASWSEIDRNTGKIKKFIRPRDLDPELGPEDE